MARKRSGFYNNEVRLAVVGRCDDIAESVMRSEYCR